MTPRKVRLGVLPFPRGGDGASVLPLSPAAPAADDVEVRYLKDMMDQQFLALLAADLCLGRAIHPELEALCVDSLDARAEEIHLMQEWLAEWYGIRREPELGEEGRKLLAQLARRKGARLEIDLMHALLRHHKETLSRAAECMERAGHAELRELCADMVEEHVTENVMLEDWLFEWYGIDRQWQLA